MKQAPATYIRWILAEFLGTAFLSSTVAVLITSAYLGIEGYRFTFIPFFVGLVLMLIVMFFGWVSGAHVNPAVTISQALFRKISLQQGGIYLVSQLLGGFVGVRLANLLLGTPSLNPTATNTSIIVGEFVGTMILGFAVMLAVTKRVPAATVPAIVGGGLMLGLILSAHTGGGVLNPAIAFGLGSYTLTYLAIPIVGAICGAAIAVLFDETATSDREA